MLLFRFGQAEQNLDREYNTVNFALLLSNQIANIRLVSNEGM